MGFIHSCKKFSILLFLVPLMFAVQANANELSPFVWDIDEAPSQTGYNINAGFDMFEGTPYLVEPNDGVGLRISHKAQDSWISTTILPTECDVLECNNYSNYDAYYDTNGIQLVISDSGIFHIAYESDIANRLVYLTNSSGEWVYSVVTDEVLNDEFSLALNPQGMPRIVFVHEVTKQVYFSVPVGTNWIHSKIPTMIGHIHHNVSLQYAPNGYPHVVYHGWEPQTSYGHADSYESPYDVTVYTRYSYNSPNGWQSETIDSNSQPGGALTQPIIRMSQFNEPHVMYGTGFWLLNLNYATKSNNVWKESNVIPEEYNFKFGFQLDKNDKPYLLYNTYNSLIIGSIGSDNSWHFSPIYRDFFTSLNAPFLSIDKKDKFHIIAHHNYSEAYNYRQRYYLTNVDSQTATSWESDILPTDESVSESSLTVGGDYGVMFKKDNELLYRLSESGDSIDLEVVTTLLVEDGWYYFDLVDDAMGSIHVVYVHVDNGEYDYSLDKYINKVTYYYLQRSVSGQWSAPQVITTFSEDLNLYDEKDIGLHALSLNPDGLLRMAFVQENELWWAIAGNNNWAVGRVPNDGLGASGSVSMAYDSTGYPHFAYVDNTQEKVLYTYRDSGGWHTVEVFVPETADFDTVNSAIIQLDSQNKPHISYLVSVEDAFIENSKSTLVYAQRPATTWQSKIVAEGNPSNKLQIDEFDFVLDKSGQPHFAYMQKPQPSKTLQYSQCSLIYSSEMIEWDKEIVEDAGCYGMRPSITVSSDKDVYISHFERIRNELQLSYRRNTEQSKIFIPIAIR